MKAAYFYGKEDIRVEEVPVPEVNDNEMLLKIKLACICGTGPENFPVRSFQDPGRHKTCAGA